MREQFLCGYGDRREEATFAYESVDYFKNEKITKLNGKWLEIGLATGQAYAMCLICRLVLDVISKHYIDGDLVVDDLLCV